MRKINVQVSSGLGDRLLTLLFYHVNFGSENEINFFWEKNHCLNCDYHNLLNNKIKLSYDVSNSFFLHPQVSAINRKALIQNYLNLVKDDVHINGEVFDKTCDFKKLYYKKYFQEIINPVDKIKQITEDYVENNFDGKVIGVHLRVADKFCLKTLSFFSPKKSLFEVLQEYEKSIAHAEDDCKILFSTDDSGPKSPNSSEIQDLKLRDYFKEKYGSRIIEFPCRSLNRNSEEGIFDAFCTLVLLSKCDYFVGSSSSSFSKLICANFEDDFILV